MRKGFILNLNRCVGCQACVLACQIENHAMQSVPWRSVATFNGPKHPLLPVLHFSLACNHCDVPLCLDQCPTGAYTRNESLKTIDHDSDRCIGCQYCMWVCPYDAPKFSPVRGVVEKCTMCSSRIEHGLKPNCATLCPTGALDFGDIDADPAQSVDGFPEKGLHPGIRIIPLRTTVRQRETDGSRELESGVFKNLVSDKLSTASTLHEWPLIVFTLLAPLLWGLLTASIFRPIDIDPLIFFILGVAAIGASALHLGRPFRAWRSVTRWKTSWLSREILAYALFLAFSLGAFLVPSPEFFKAAASFLGFTAIVCMDMVYRNAEGTPGPGTHSGSVVLTGLLFFSIFFNSSWYVVAVLGLKLVLYAYEFIRSEERRLLRSIVSFARFVVGFILPLFALGDPSRSILLVVLIVVAELINRSEFYWDLHFESPQRKIVADLFRLLELRQTGARSA
ncbi:MAG TPA: DmsC/YnfH family molybdoenzyme membrane anchor subunit [Bacteroidota bacterium]|nr:DmsC/YnfH family molybdoenzyme membrane anchor subunit [Bacteroidota bacterium]